MNRAFTTDRRASPRYPAIANCLSIDRSDESADRRSSAHFLNVSRGGASFTTKCVPPLDRPFWLRVEHPVRTDWVTATVVWFDGAERVGVSLHQPCLFIFDAVTLGIDFGSLLPAYEHNLSDTWQNDDLASPPRPAG
jgi:hypothetical protein